MNMQEYIDEAEGALLHTYNRYPVVLDRGEGVYLYDTDGIKYLAQRIKAVQAQYPRIRVHLYSGDRSDLAERLEQGLLDFAVLVESNDLSKYNYLPLPGADTWGVILRKGHPLAEREAITPEDLMEIPLICPRQGLQKELSDWFQEKVDRLNIVATCNLAYNGGVLAREGLGCLLSFDGLVDTGPDSPLCFQPLTPALHSKLFFTWKKYAVFFPAAEVLLNEMKEHYSA